MAPKPPSGHGPAMATRGIPTRVIVAVVAGALTTAVLLVLINLAVDLGALGSALIGAVGALAVIVPRNFSYAAGTDWIRRGPAWVVTTELTEATVAGERTLRLRNRSARRKVTVPLGVLADHPELYDALAPAVRHSHAQGGLHTDAEARALFRLPEAQTT